MKRLLHAHVSPVLYIQQFYFLGDMILIWHMLMQCAVFNVSLISNRYKILIVT